MILRANFILMSLTWTVSSCLVYFPLWAQQTGWSSHKESFLLSSGLHSAAEKDTAGSFKQTVRVTGAPFLQLHFSDFNLGEQSYLKITSLKDGGWQRLDARTLPQWRNGSAFFNGDAVEVELYVAQGEAGIFFQIDELTVGEEITRVLTEAPAGPMTLCGGDNRGASTDNRVGRLVLGVCPAGGGCTAWRIANGLLVTAGHCADFEPPDGTLDLTGVVEFNVPLSQSNGNIVCANPNDQYPVNLSYVAWENTTGPPSGGIDWAVFTVSPNSNTGLLPHQAYGGFFRISDEIPIAAISIRITGCGVDSTPAGSGGGANAQSQTLQTSTGPYDSYDSDAKVHRYKTDTEAANSGSPIIDDQYNVSMGIHTGAGCGPGNGGSNVGTSFNRALLVTYIDDFLGTNVEYVDNGHPFAPTFGETGSLIRPWNTVLEGVNAAPSGGLVAIVTGSYPGAMTINKAVTLKGLMGTVTIGK